MTGARPSERNIVAPLSRRVYGPTCEAIANNLDRLPVRDAVRPGLRIRNGRNAGQHAVLSDQVSSSFVRAPRWMLPGICHLGQSGRSRRCHTQSHGIVSVGWLGRFCAEAPNRHPVANGSFAGAAPSRGVGPPMLATALIPFQN